MTAFTKSQNTPAFSFDTQILKAYDVRGVYRESLTDEAAEMLGYAFACMVRKHSGNEFPRIVTARDGRQSSPALSKALSEGMKKAGAVVLDGGVGPTPMLYFGVYQQDADAGIMVTGSHNPPTHNGFKMMMGHKPFYGDDILELGRLMNGGIPEIFPGHVESAPLFEPYVERLMQGFRPEGAKPLKVVWDAGNGAAGEAMAALVKKLPGQHYLLFEKIDGNFPNHHPDPTIPANLQDLIQKVAEVGADLGVAFDGDGDRLGAVDGQGRILWGDQLLMFYSREILSRKPGATIIADVKASETLFEDIAKHGGNPLMWKTGHSLIKAKMAEVGAPVAGEMSGHLFFADGYYGFDDGLYAAIRLLDLIAHSGQSLAEMRDGIPEAINTPEIRIDVDASRKFAIVEEIRDRLKKGTHKVNEVDGVRVSVNGGWWLARASNTQSAIIVRCEATSTAQLEELKDMVREQLNASGIKDVSFEPSAGH